MKKIYSLIALLLMVAVGVSAQKYHTVELQEEITPGVTYVLKNVSFENPYLNANQGPQSVINDEDILWQFEETGETTEDGYPLYVLKSLTRGYWYEDYFDGDHMGYDGYDIYTYLPTCATFGPDKAQACRFTALMAGSVGHEWRDQGGSGGFIFARNEGQEQEDGGMYFYKIGCQGSSVAFEPWNEHVAWQVWTVAESTEADKLQELCDMLAGVADEAIIGNAPGQATQANLDAFNEAFSAAEAAIADGEDEACKTAYAALDAAYAKLYNPVTPGYYFIVSGYDAFEENQGSQKAWYGESAVKPRWKNIDREDPSFVWQITAKNDGFAIANVLYTAQMVGSTAAGNSQKLSMAPTTDRTTYFEMLGDAQWKIYNSFSNIGYHTESHSSGNGVSGDLVTWNTGAHNGSAWILEPITDQAIVDKAIKEAAQAAIKADLSALVVEAGSLYDNLFVTTADLEQPLITEADDNAAPGEEGCQFLYPRKEGSEGRYAALIDGVLGTSEWGGGNKDGNDDWAYFHGAWAGLAWPDQPYTDANKYKDFMQVDISKTPVSSFVLRTVRRYNNANAQPTQLDIYVTNDTTGYWAEQDQWTFVRSIYPPVMGQEEWYTSPLIELGAEAKYVRFVIAATNNNARYCTYAEFQMYPGAVSQEYSQYYSSEDMQTAADAMKAAAEAAATAMTEGTATQEMVPDLRAKIDAVKALYADPAELQALIATAERELQFVEVGDEMGNISTQEAVDGYNNALTAAQAIDLEGLLKKSELDAATNGLKAAKNAFLNAMVTPEAGKWYYISNLVDVERAEESNGALVYAEELGEGAAIRWGGSIDETGTHAAAMWMPIAVEGAETPNTVYLQNMATGLYLGAETVNLSNVAHLSTTPVPYVITYVGGSRLAICAAENNTNKTSLHAQIAGHSVVGWYYNLGGVDAQGNSSNAASLWTFNAVDMDEVEGVVVTLTPGESIVTLPFAVEGLSEYNDAKFYAIANIEGETVSLYEKDSFAAGEPFIIEIEAVDPEAETPVAEIIVPTPETVAPNATTANGLVGTFAKVTGLEGVGISKAGEWVAAAKADVIKTGYINPNQFSGVIDGVEITKTITIDGLKGAGVAGDVNMDGNINAADVVAIYNYITDGAASGINAALADVNEDNAVSAADVVAIYAIISGETIKSNSYVEASIIEDGDNTVARLTAAIGNSDDLTAVPVTIFLNNSIDIVAAEYVVVAPVEPAKFVFDEEEDDYMINNTDRWSKGHNAVMIPGTDLHGQDGFFVSITDSKNRAFAGNEGSVATVYFDATGLGDGEYEVTIKDGIAITKATDTYKTADMTLKFVVANGKATGLSTITAAQIATAKSIVNLQGQPVAAPVKGQIYVVDGAVVKY